MKNTNEKLNGLTLELSSKGSKEIYKIVGIEKSLLVGYDYSVQIDDQEFLKREEYSIVLGANEDYRLLIDGQYYGEENWTSEEIVYTIAESRGWV